MSRSSEQTSSASLTVTGQSLQTSRSASLGDLVIVRAASAPHQYADTGKRGLATALPPGVRAIGVMPQRNRQFAIASA